MEIVKIFEEVLSLEAKAIESARSSLSKESLSVIDTIFASLITNNAKIVFCGVGKSGIVAKKAVATFNSLGLVSTYLHPVEALHGDLGAISSNDVMVLISKSGTTEEVLKLAPFLPMNKSNIIGLLGNMESPIAQLCQVSLDCSVEKEACINNQAPTTSTTVALAVADALAVFYEHKVGLSKEKFAINHPGGFLGKSLRLKVAHLMFDKSNCAVCAPDSSLREAMLSMTSFNTGGCAILNPKGELEGLIVEGDIRRSLSKSDTNEIDLETKVSSIMNSAPVIIDSSSLAIDALKLMEQRESSISILPVVDKGLFKGFISLHELLKHGLKNQ